MVKILPGTELPTLLKYSLWRYYVRTAISLLVGWALCLMKLSDLLVYVLYVLPYQKQAQAFCWPSMEVYKIFLNLDMQSRCWMNVAITLRVLIISVSGLWMQNKAAKNLGITWNCLAVCHKFKGDRIFHIHGWTGCRNPILLKENAFLWERRHQNSDIKWGRHTCWWKA